MELHADASHSGPGVRAPDHLQCIREASKQLRIIFIGDSLARYTYLALALLAEHPLWNTSGLVGDRLAHLLQPNPLHPDVEHLERYWQLLPASVRAPLNDTPGCVPARVARFNPKRRHQFWAAPDLRWQTAYRHSNQALGTHEQCDCARTLERKQQVATENRRYTNGRLTMEFFFWGGWQETAGSLSLDPSKMVNLSCGPGRVLGNASGHQQPAWSRSAADLLRLIANEGGTRPTHVFIGTDDWFDVPRFGERADPNRYDWTDLAAAARYLRVRTNATVLWTTTPQPLVQLLPNSSKRRMVHRHGPEAFARVGLPTFEGAELADRLQYDLIRDGERPSASWSMPGSALFSRDGMHLLPAGTVALATELLRRYVCQTHATNP